MKKKKFLSMLLVLAMVLSLMPAMSITASAAGTASSASALQTAVNGGGTVTLTGNFALDRTITIPSGTTVTLDMAGYSLTRSSTDKCCFEVKGTLKVINNSTTKTSSITGFGTRDAASAVKKGDEYFETLFFVNGGTLFLNTNDNDDGAIVLKDNQHKNGGAVWVENGTLCMYDNVTIQNCEAEGGTDYNEGGAVYVKDSTFYMYGGTITGCVAERGGGVYLYRGKFYMSGGTIENCSAKNSGGVFVDGNSAGANKAYFEMTGGTLKGNTSNNPNTDAKATSVIAQWDGTAKIDGGYIAADGSSTLPATDYGSAESITITSGRFSPDNTYYYKEGSSKKSSLSNKSANIALNANGGSGGTSVIPYWNTYPASVTPPTRTGYTFTGYYNAQSGGEQYFDSNGNPTRKNDYVGSVTFYAYWSANKYSITYLDEGGAAFTGTHASSYPTKHTYGTATTLKTASKDGYEFGGWYTDSACTDGNKVTSLGATSYTSAITLYAKWVPHDLSYTAVDNVLTATCANSPCELTDNKATLTLSASDAIYDGAAHTASFASGEAANWKKATGSDPVVSYYAEGETEPMSGAPINVGSYTAKVTGGEGDGAATAEKAFTINKANLTVSDFTFNSAPSLVYDGNTKPASVTFKPGTNGRTGCGSVKVFYQKKTGETTWDTATTDAPKDAGTYKVSISVDEGTNFNATDLLTADGWKFTIAQREVSLNWQPASGTGAIDLVYSGTAKVPTVTADNVVSGEKVKIVAELTSGKSNVNAGDKFTFTATGLENESGDTTNLANYKLPSNVTSGSYTITKFLTTLTNVTTKLDYTGEKQYISFTPTSPTGAADALKQEDFTVKYYKVDEDYETVIKASPLTGVTSIGRYIYVVTLNDEHDNYQFDPSKTFDETVTTSTTESDVQNMVNAGVVAVGVSIPAQQKPISFQSGLVDKLTTDSAFTNALTNENSGATTTYTSSNTAVATIATDGTVTIVGAGSTTITATSSLSGMTDVYAAYTLNVSKKEVTVTVKDQSVTYGAASPYDAVDDLIFSPAIDTTGITPTFTTSYAVGKGVNEYTVRVALPDNDTYSYVYEPGTLSVTPKTLTVSDFTVTAENKGYDGKTDAVVTAVPASGKLVGSDTLTVTAVGTFADADVGTGKTVSFEITGISGTKAGNYQLAANMTGETTASITAAKITFTFGDAEFAYDGSKKTVAVSAVDEDGHVFTDFTVYYVGTNYTKSTDAPVNVGSYTVKAEYNTTNYALSEGNSNSANMNITKGNAVVWASSGTEHLYNDASKTITAVSVPNLEMDVTYYAVAEDGTVGDAVTPADLGRYLYVITLKDNDANKNYAISGALSGTPTGKVDALSGSNIGIMTVENSVQPELTVDQIVVTKAYGDAPFSQTVTGGAEGATITYSIPNEAEREFATVNAETGEITILKPGTVVVEAKASKTGYSDTTARFAVIIEKRLVTITLEDSITYAGQPIPAPYTVTNDVESNRVQTSDIQFVYQNLGETENPGTFRDVGTYYVTAEIPSSNVYYRTNGAASKNIDITKADLTVTADDKTVTYGDMAPAYTLSYTPLGDDVAGCLDGTAEYTCEYAQFDDADEYNISVTGLTSDNYNIIFADGTLTVDSLPVSLSWSESSFTYDGEAHSVTATVSNAVNGDAVTVSDYTDNTSIAAGEYTAEATELDNSNYTLTGGTDVTKTWSITAKSVTVKPANVSIYVNGTAELKLDFSELLSADQTFTGTPTFALTDKDGQSIDLADAVKTAGTYTITWTNPDAVTFSGNYTVTKELTAALTVSNPSSGGGGGSTAPKKNTIETIEQPENGTIEIDPETAAAGDTVTITVTPDENFTLDTLKVLDKNGNEIELTDLGDGKYSFVMPSGAVSVEASFAELPGYATCHGDDTCPSSKFTDVDVTEWYHDGVHFCVENGIMKGVSETEFDTEGDITRGMIVTMLWRLDGEKYANYAMTFEDVPADEWYTEAIRWAAAEKIVNGYDTEHFGPEDSITREQLATILYNYAKYKGQGFTGDWMFLLDFVDTADISNWANEAIHWCSMKGIVNGKEGKRFDPQGNATRAEAATMMQRFCETLDK